MCFYIVLRHGPNPFNPLKQRLGLRTPKTVEDAEWGARTLESRRVEWQVERLSWADAWALLRWAIGGTAVSVDDERQPLMCECCGDRVKVIESMRQCSC